MGSPWTGWTKKEISKEMKRRQKKIKNRSKKCSVCVRVSVANGLCRSHYDIARRMEKKKDQVQAQRDIERITYGYGVGHRFFLIDAHGAQIFKVPSYAAKLLKDLSKSQ